MNAVFNLHDRATLTVVGGNAGYRRYFENEYGRASARREPMPGLSIEVRLVHRLPPAQRDDRLRTVRFKRLFTFRFLVRGFDTRAVTIFFERHPVDRVYALAVGVFLQAHILEPILYAKWLEEDAILLHAAGIEMADGAVLFPAHGGTGKTTLALRLARRGAALLGDDLVLVDVRGGLAYPHPRPLHLFSYNLRQFQEVRFPWPLRAVIGFKDLVRPVLETLLRTEFLISTRAHVDAVLPDLRWASAPATLRRIVFLSTSVAAESLSANDPGALDRAARMLAEAADLNRSLRSYVLEPSETAAFEVRELDVLRRLVSRVGEMKIVNPRSTPLEDLERGSRTVPR